jgi:hypothetical protein
MLGIGSITRDRFREVAATGAAGFAAIGLLADARWMGRPRACGKLSSPRRRL